MKKGRKRLALITGAALLVCAGVAFADMTVRQKEFAKAEDKDFNAQLASANEACEAKMTARIDWESFKAEIDRNLEGKDKGKYNFGYCAEPLSRMRWMCERPEGKAAIQKRIKSYTCKFGGKGKRKIDLKGSTLTMWVDWEAGLYPEFIDEFLGKKL
jgi:hypothetical protein